MSMSDTDVMLIGGALAIAWLIMRSSQAQAAQAVRSPDLGQAGDFSGLVAEWNGWSYYEDGIAVDPFGAYYRNGERVYDPVVGDLT